MFDAIKNDTTTGISCPTACSKDPKSKTGKQVCVEKCLHSPNFLLNGHLIDEYKGDGMMGWDWRDLYAVKSGSDVVRVGPHSYGFVVLEQQVGKGSEKHVGREKLDLADVEEQVSDAWIIA